MAWCYQRNRHCQGSDKPDCCGHAAWKNAQFVRALCGHCGQEYSGQHYCPAFPNPGGARESRQLTEADVRRIVREELAARFPSHSQEVQP